MKISELINRLEDIKEVDGDLDVLIYHGKTKKYRKVGTCCVASEDKEKVIADGVDVSVFAGSGMNLFIGYE